MFVNIAARLYRMTLKNALIAVLGLERKNSKLALNLKPLCPHFLFFMLLSASINTHQLISSAISHDYLESLSATCILDFMTRPIIFEWFLVLIRH